MFKVVSKKDFESLQFKTSCRDKTEFTKAIESLSVGSALIIKKEEWEHQSPPISRLYSARKSGSEFSCRTLADDAGWAILRTK